MFDRFTDRSKKVMNFARQEAQRFNHEYLGTEHILLGLVQEGGGVGANVLKGMSLDLALIRREVEKIVKHGPKSAEMPHQLPFTPRAKKVLELSMEEASNLGHNYIGTEHLLLGLIKENEGIAAQVLMSLDVKLEDVREEVLEFLGAGGGDDELSKEHATSRTTGRPPATAPAAGSTPPRSKTPALDAFGRDLNELARHDKLDPVRARDAEFERLMQLLSRRNKNSVVLLGKPGVGKTALVEGLAQRITAGAVPPHLRDRRVIALDLPRMVAGTKGHGQFEERFDAVMSEARSSGAILFFQRLELLLAARGADSAIDAADMLTPALARSEITCIGETTTEVFRDRIAPLAAIGRCFQPLLVEPATPAETLAILRGMSPRFEAHHHVRCVDALLTTIIELALQHDCGRELPDKALDLLDECGARVAARLSKEARVAGQPTPEITAEDVAQTLAAMAVIPRAATAT